MKGYALRQLSVNGVQLVLNQLFGVAIFYLLSVQLSKTDFGRVNLALAILLGLYSLLSMGMDSLAVKKAAAGQHRQSLLPAYQLHVWVTGMFGITLLWVATPWFPQHLFPLLPLLGLGKLFLYLSTPYKQITSGHEKFALLARMSLVSNGIRCAGLLTLLAAHSFSLHNAVLLFIAGDLAELIASAWFFRSLRSDTTGTSTILPPAENIPGTWRLLLKEAAPQGAVVLITSVLARFDWICLGFFGPAGRLAEYSFAYKAFEMAQLPLLMIAPLLLPRFTRFFRNPGQETGKLQLLLQGEIIIATGTAVLIQVAWVPVIDFITAGRYGAVNQQTITLLCCCLPLIYVNNFLWTAWFAEGRLRQILYSFIIAAGVNAAGCLTLIPRLGNSGAALAFLLSSAAQTGYYLFSHRQPGLHSAWKDLCLYSGCGLLVGFSGHFFSTPPAAIFSSLVLYGVLVCFFSPLPARLFRNLRRPFSFTQPANRQTRNHIP